MEMSNDESNQSSSWINEHEISHVKGIMDAILQYAGQCEMSLNLWTFLYILFLLFSKTSAKDVNLNY